MTGALFAYNVAQRTATTEYDLDKTGISHVLFSYLCSYHDVHCTASMSDWIAHYV